MHPDESLDWYVDHVVLAQANKESQWQTHWRVAAERARRVGPVGRLAARQGFVLTRAQLRQCGVADAEVRRRVRSGQWNSPRRAVIAPVPRDPQTAHVLQACAAALVRPAHVVSHRSAAVLHGLPLVHLSGRERPGVELTYGGSTLSRSSPGIRVRTARIPDWAVTDWYGAAVTSPARTVVDLARLDRAQGLAAADAVLRLGLARAGELDRAVADGSGLPGSRAAASLVAMASGLSELVLESITRLFLADHGFPPPQLQVWISDPADGWRARVDMLWAERRLVLEADGRVKYTDQRLWEEKIRQERLEQLGYRVVRVRWAEIVRCPEATARRLARALHLL